MPTKSTPKRKRQATKKTSFRGFFGSKLLILAFVAGFAVIGYMTLRNSGAQSLVLYSDIDKYCQFHVMGSLYADGGGNGPPNGYSWKVPHSSWTYSPPETGQANRFEYCATQMATTNGGKVTRSGNKIELTNFTINLPYNDLPPALLAQSDKRAYRAFLTSVVEGEGNSAGKLDDNFRCLSGTSCNDFYALHVIKLSTAVQRAGWGSYFVKGDGAGCATGIVDATSIQKLSDSDPNNDPQTGGLSICLNAANIDEFASLPHASCTGRVPGGITKCSQLVSDTTPPSIPANLRVVENKTTGVKLVWDASRDQSGIKRYRIRRDGAFYTTVTPPTTSFVDTAVVPGNTYRYRVSATDNNGNQSLFSTELVVTVPTN